MNSRLAVYPVTIWQRVGSSAQRPDVLKQAGVAMGALPAAFGIRTRRNSAVMVGEVYGTIAAHAESGSGVLSASAFLQDRSPFC